MSGALLLLGAAPLLANAACDPANCLTTAQDNLLLDNGSWFGVGTGGRLTNSTVSNGQLHLWDSGVAVRTTLKDDGWLALHDNSHADDTVMENGVMLVSGSATALHTRVTGGDLEVVENAAVSSTLLNGGRMYVYFDALAKNTTVNNSQMTVYQHGNADRTTVNEGGVLSVFDEATATNTEVNQGGVMDIVAGTHVYDSTVNQGGMMVLGDRADASDTTLNQGGFLQLKGDGILGGVNHVDGQVAFADPAINGFHTLLIKGPLSGNGTFLMNTDLAARQGDLINVLGPVSGTHTLVVADSGNTPTSARALALVDGNGGSGDFKLYGETVDAGAYRYQLQQIGEDWYLANSAEVDPIDEPNGPDEPQPPVDPVDPVDPVVPVAPVDPVVPADPVAPVNPVVPADPVAPVDPVKPVQPTKPVQPPRLPQAETLSKGANAAVGQQAASAALISAQMNATTGHFGELRSGKDQGGLWARGYGAEQHLDTRSSRGFQQQLNGMEIGADTALSFANGTLFVGGLLGKGQGRQHFGEASKGTIDSATVGGYASYLDHSGVYVDGALKYSRLDNQINITSNVGDKVKAKYKNHAVSADVQVGQSIDLGKGWFVEPQAGVQVSRISGGRYTASSGLSVEQDAMLSVQSRVGGMFGRNLALDNGVTVKPYATATWVTEHAGDSHVKVSGARLDSRLPGSRAEIGGGVLVTTADKHNIYVEGEYTKGRDIEQPWAVTVGYRYNW